MGLMHAITNLTAPCFAISTVAFSLAQAPTARPIPAWGSAPRNGHPHITLLNPRAEGPPYPAKALLFFGGFDLGPARIILLQKPILQRTHLSRRDNSLVVIIRLRLRRAE